MDDSQPRRTSVSAYRMFGHYSFKARDGGVRLTLELAPGYSVGEWIDGSQLIVGHGRMISVEQAIYHGFAQIVE